MTDLAAIVARPTDELERLAKDASAERWYDAGLFVAIIDDDDAYVFDPDDAAYIAALSPDVVLALLADRRALLVLLRETRDALADQDIGRLVRNAAYGRAQTNSLVQAHNRMQALIDSLAALDTEVPS